MVSEKIMKHLTKNHYFYYEQVHTAIVSQKYRHLQRLCVAWPAPQGLYRLCHSSATRTLTQKHLGHLAHLQREGQQCNTVMRELATTLYCGHTL